MQDEQRLSGGSLTARLDTPSVAFSPGDDIASIVKRVANEAPDRVALVLGDRTATYRVLDEQIDRVASALTSLSTGRGARVAVLAANSIEYVEVFFGALRAGASVVPLPTLSSREALESMLVDSDAKILFVGDAYGALAASLHTPGVLHRVALGGEARSAETPVDGSEPYAAFLARARPTTFPEIVAEDTFDVIYSSGTTGVPKGIVHSHAARKASYGGSRAAYFDETSVNVVATPFYSNTTCITWLLTTAKGGTNVLLPKFSAEAFLDAVERHRGTHAMLVPTQYDRIFSSPHFGTADVSSLRMLFSTSAPLRAEVKRRILDETRAELVEIYGLTEGGPVTVLECRKHPDKLGTVGIPSPGTELRVVDETGNDVPPGATGEILGRSANMMSGYLNRPEDTAALVFRDGTGKLYFRTGDIGRIDDDGFLSLLDRKKDVIISGGFNVYATDLEAVLAQHEAVSEVTVIGIPSERWGETPLALVVPREGARATEDELLEWLNARVGKAQRAFRVEFRPELPKSPIGKILKRELREPYWTTAR